MHSSGHYVHSRCCATTTTTRRRSSSSFRTETLYPCSNSPSPCSGPGNRRSTFSLCLHYSRHFISGESASIHPFVTGNSCTIMPLRSTDAVAPSAPPSFFRLNGVSLHGYMTHSVLSGHLGWFPIWLVCIMGCKDWCANICSSPCFQFSWVYMQK